MTNNDTNITGNCRYTPTQGMDFVLDLLLSYRKFRGRRMSIPVRRHAYLRRSFASPLVRLVEENDLKKVTTKEKVVVAYRSFLKKSRKI